VTSRAYTTLVALATLAIVLQGLWAGLFLDHGQSGNWLEVHARGGEVAIVLVAIAAVVGFVRLRRRRDLWLGAAMLTVLLVLEAYLGGLIHDSGKESLTAVHVPLAMAIVGMTVWLLVRSRRSSG
jgi:heme A synthase